MAKKKNEIIIWTNDNCPYCKRVKDTLDEANINYTAKLTSEHRDEWIEVIGNLGMGNVPTIHYKNTYFVPGRDFNQPDHLVNILTSFKEPTFSTEKLMYERIKNMNWNMAQAFQKVDLILTNLQNKLNTKEDEHESTD